MDWRIAQHLLVDLLGWDMAAKPASFTHEVFAT
jgi:hypothetical protein